MSWICCELRRVAPLPIMPAMRDIIPAGLEFIPENGGGPASGSENGPSSQHPKPARARKEK
ncbi:hypothetical protein GCM10007888_60420 [Methylobacterium oxalidis]|uniref:Uncharacterized protein n=1 Tax=Methylobacterium oxalidis TaxID=944322 RepID=A0ABQ6DU23_9HYPH|nr:hypothetical protein GCM10007888_60420 [Methylobacterium oxalidis]